MLKKCFLLKFSDSKFAFNHRNSKSENFGFSDTVEYGISSSQVKSRFSLLITSKACEMAFLDHS